MDGGARRPLPAVARRARCRSTAPTPSSSAAARRWSTPTTPPPRTWASPILYEAQVAPRRHRRPPLHPCRGRGRRRAPACIEGGAAVLASGGFQADIDWLARAWGPAARNFLIRGTPYNRGVVLQRHARPGRRERRRPDPVPRRRHRRPRAEVRRRHRHPARLRALLGRGEPRRRALLRRGRGRLAQALRDLGPARRGAARPGRLRDHRHAAPCRSSCRRSIRRSAATRVEELAGKLGLDGAGSPPPWRGSTPPAGPASSARRSSTGSRPRGSTPPKTNWARPIVEPPFYGYSLRPGVTFTYLGLKVDAQARVDGAAAGSTTTSGRRGRSWPASILGEGYLAGFGMTIGTVFGRLAGQGAAAHGL